MDQVNELEVLHCNLDKSKNSQHEFILSFMAGQFQIALVSEPYVGSGNIVKSIPGINIFQFSNGNRVKACIMTKSSCGSVLGLSQFSSANLSAVQLNIGGCKLYIASVYIEPNSDDHNTLQRLDNFLKMTSNCHQLVGGDFNGWHPIWGSERANSRGNEVVDIVYGNDMFLCNRGHTPTFETVSYGRVRSSYIDLTLASSSIYDRITDWKVDPSICLSSEHRAVMFSVTTHGKRRKTNKTTSTFRYNTNNIKWEELRASFEAKIKEHVPQNVMVEQMQPNELENYMITVTSAIQKTCDELLPRSTGRKYRCPWWTDELECLKKQVIRNHHNIQKLRRQNKPLEDALLEKERLKTANSKTFRETSTRNFRDFCERQGKEDVWSVTNRIIKSSPPALPPATLKKSDGSYTTTSLETAQALLDKFFPDDDLNDTTKQENARNLATISPNTPDEPPFTYEEILSSLNSMNPKTAPGMDHLTSDICLLFVKSFPDLTTSVINRCFKLGYFQKFGRKLSLKFSLSLARMTT
ncbi:unnamed protein product [Parnassius mnemosyne]|uniref:Endonuclease/exonuclease/phosphatase domain-containing protein n=1 Tax=Parnassius mnemosyne TaxID=213953 RepID=A0AAV1L761_9NEOP